MNCTMVEGRGRCFVLVIIMWVAIGLSGCGDDCDVIVDPPPPEPDTETWDIRFYWDVPGGKYIHSTAEVAVEEASIRIETDSIWSTYDDYEWNPFTAEIWGGMYNDTLYLVEGRKYDWNQGEELDVAEFVYCHDRYQPIALQYNEENGTFSIECIEIVSKKTGIDGPYKIEGTRR